MRPAAFPLAFILLAAAAYAAPVLFDPFPQNNSFIKGGNFNFSINATSSAFNSSSAVLFLISKSAYEQGEGWDRYAMQCVSYADSSWNCIRTVSFAIAGSDTPELFYFEANDSSGGSLGSAASPLRFTLDRNPPSIVIDSPANNSYVSGNVTIQVSVADSASGVNSSTVQFSLDNLTWNNVTGSSASWNSSAYADNTTVIIYLRARDNVNNLAETRTIVRTDNEAPRLEITSPQNGTAITGTYTFRVAANDTFSGIGSSSLYFANSNFAMTCEGKNSANCSTMIDTTVYADNTYNATFTVHDAAGNLRNSTVTFSTKNSVPLLNITLASGSLLKGAVEINLTIINAGGIITGVNLTLENGQPVYVGQMGCNSAYTSCSYLMNTAQFQDGQRTLTAAAANTLGYTLKSSVAVSIDNTKPQVSITTPGTVKGSWIAEATVTDSNPDSNKVTFKIDSASQAMFCTTGGTTLSCKATYDTTQTSDGVKTFEVSATDKAGNALTALANVTVDNKPPEFKFIKIEPVSTASPRAVNFTVGLEDIASSVKSAQVTIRHSEFTAAIDLVKASNVWFGKATIISYGSHTVGVKAEDQSGNSATYNDRGYFYIGPLSCGDGVCQAAENSCLCALDCTAPVCTGVLDCSSGLPVCGAVPLCGNGICSSGESCSTCATDCGTCASIAAADKTIDDKQKGSSGIGREAGTKPATEAEVRYVFAPVIGFIRDNPLVAVTVVAVAITLLLLFLTRRRKPSPAPAI